MRSAYAACLLAVLAATPVPAAVVADQATAKVGPAVTVASANPWDQWEFTFESGLLWRIRNNTPIDYVIAPTQFVFHGPPHFTVAEGGHGALVVRPRLALLAESILEGPESYFLGFSGSPSLEWWLPGNRTSLFFAAGGGCGVVDSTGEPGGQGQDFTLNWFMQLGIRHLFDNGWSVLGGAYFQHVSNGGQTDPNPGIDALGFTLGVGWKF